MPASTTPTRTCRWRCGRCKARIRRSGTAPRTRPAPRGRASTACTSSPTGRPTIPRSTSTPIARRWPSAAGRRSRSRNSSGGAAVGGLRHIVVAETDAEARKIAKPNVDYHVNSLNWLRKMHATERGAGARPRAARRHLRGVGEGRHGDRRLARDGGRRDRAAGRQARHQLPAHLSVLRHHDARAGAALARTDAHRGDAEDRASCDDAIDGRIHAHRDHRRRRGAAVVDPGGDRGDAGCVPRPVGGQGGQSAAAALQRRHA